MVLFPVLGICLPTAPHCDLIGHQASRVSVKSVRSRQGAADPDPTGEADRLVFPPVLREGLQCLDYLLFAQRPGSLLMHRC